MWPEYNSENLVKRNYLLNELTDSSSENIKLSESWKTKDVDKLLSKTMKFVVILLWIKDYTLML